MTDAGYSLDEQNEIYSDGFKKYGESPLALHWTSYKTAAMRFKNLVEDLDIEDRSILDAGCGMGDLLPFLYAKTANFKYLGMDINPQFIKVAKKRYEGHDFKVGDPFFGKIKPGYDIVLSSGVMNIKLQNWLAIRKKMITQMFELANEAVAFNMAGGLGPQEDDSLIAYADANEILDFCETLAPTKIVFKNNYSSLDFTIILHK